MTRIGNNTRGKAEGRRSRGKQESVSVVQANSVVKY
jgi:hypothetical protein